MKRHIEDADLALYASGDVSLMRRVEVRLHLSRCERCHGLASAFRADRDAIRKVSNELPEGLDWDRLSAEMSANIHVGLAAGECVAPRPRRRPAFAALHPAALMSAAAAGLIVLLGGAWWLNMPPGEIGRVWAVVRHVRGSVPVDDFGPVVEASSSGIELRENGSTFGVSQGTARPVAFSVSVQGSASARYVDADTGQVTVTSVYVQ
jgi:anti-sigma factor RsiW